MGSGSRVIDHVDFRLPVVQGMCAVLESAIERLNDEHAHVEVAPRLKGKLLLMNSNDFIALVGYIDPEDLTEFELRRFLADATKELDQQLLRSVKVDHQSHYKWCIAALKNLPAGRFLGEKDSSDEVGG